MSTSIHQLLESFDQLPETEKREVAAEILRRTINFDLPEMSDEELTLNAEQLFLQLDAREAEDEKS